MMKWLLSKFGSGPKAIELPEAKTEDVRTLYFGRFSPTGNLRWEFDRLPEVFAVMKRIGDTVLELKANRDEKDSSIEQAMKKSIRHFIVPPITWVDRV